MKRTIEDSNFVTIHGWAITQLHLTSDEAIVYSLVDGAGAIGFSDSISYLASWIGASEDTARRILRRLVDAGILEEERVAGKTTTYRCIPLANCKGSQIARGRKLQGVAAPAYIVNIDGEKAKENPSQIARGGGLVDTIDNIFNENKNNNIIIEKEEKEKKRRFTKPTVEQIAEYCAKRQNDIIAEEFFDFYESKGWMVGKSPMKNWQAAVRTWEIKHKNDKQHGNNTGNTAAAQSGAANGKPYSRIQELANAKFSLE